MKNIIFAAIGAAVIGIMGGVGGALMVSKNTKHTVVNQATGEEEVVEEKKDPIYYPIHPAFVVDIPGRNRSKFLQVDLVVMSYEQESIEAFEKHIPAIRNDLLMLFSTLTAESIEKPEDKEKFRISALETIQGSMLSKTGKPGIVDVYFTKLVAQ